METKAKHRFLVFWLLMGDLFFLCFSLWLTLFIRHGQIPQWLFFVNYVPPFLLIFIVWLLVFYISDLYGRSFYIFRKNLFGNLLAAQAVNGLIAAAFFYFLPYYGITPKTVLFIEVAVSFAVLFAWRSAARLLLNFTAKERLIIIGEGSEFKELSAELKQNEYYGFLVAASIDSLSLREKFHQGEKEKLDNLAAKEKNAIFVVESFNDLPKEIVAYLYDLMFRGIEFFSFQKLYESVFQYIPLSFVSDAWLLSNISAGRKRFYDITKRLIDILAAIFFGLISLFFYPFIILAIKFNDGGEIFFINSRVGQKGKVFQQFKFRSMAPSHGEHYWPGKEDKRITRVGSFLRQTRLDELPQLFNVLRGDMSFVGPRPDFLDFAKKLEEKIPYYNVRNLIKPGLTGWAQIQQIAPTSVEETHKRLAYDIYYMKNRSLFLDLLIILKTVRIMVSRVGV